MAKHIKILKHFNAYNPGEVALFDDEAAAQIVERKFGVEVKVDKNGTPADTAADQK
jgi:hypothetical protein